MPIFPPTDGLTIADLLDRYLAGELAPADRDAFERRLLQDPALATALSRLRMSLGDVPFPQADMSRLDVEAAWIRQRRKISASTLLGAASRGAAVGRGRVSHGVFLPRRQFSWTLGAAAVGACLAALLADGYVRARGADNAAAGSSAVYATRNGQQATVTLPDGNGILLNAASRLEVPGDYAAGNHRVRLIGEALFTIVHHTRTPFTVVAGGSTVRVLGTRFVVRRYHEDRATTVAVSEGKVAVRSAVLAAGQQAEVGPDGHFRVRPATPTQFAFATRTLVLDDIPMRAAITELNRWYDADIRLGDAALERARVRGEFALGSIADVQSILATAFDARVVRAGRVLTLYPRDEHAR